MKECSWKTAEENLWLHAECGCVISLSSFTVWALINGVVNWEFRLGCCHRRRARNMSLGCFSSIHFAAATRSGNWNYAVYSSTRSGKSPCMHTGIPCGRCYSSKQFVILVRRITRSFSRRQRKIANRAHHTRLHQLMNHVLPAILISAVYLPKAKHSHTSRWMVLF